MWCCSKSAVTGRATLRRRPTLTASTMHVFSLAHNRWARVKARAVLTWKGETQQSQIRLEALEGAKRLATWVLERSGKALLEAVKTAKKRQVAVGKMMRFWEIRDKFGDFSQWKRANGAKRRRSLLWKSAFAEFTKFTRRKEKYALRNRLNGWKEAIFRQKNKFEDKLIEGGMRLAVVCSLQGKKAALIGLKTAFKRYKGGNLVLKLWTERKKAEMEGKIRQWRRKTEAKSLFQKHEKALKMLKFAISAIVARKVEKTAIFRKIANLPFSTHKIAFDFLPKVSILSNSLQISRFQPLSKALFSPSVLIESQDSVVNLPLFASNKLNLKSALLDLASCARRKPAEVVRKWRNAVKTDISELNFRFRLFDRLGKMSQKRDLRQYFAVWKRENCESRLKTCLRRFASHSHFAVFSSFSVWKSRKVSERMRLFGLGQKCQRQLLALVARKAIPSSAPAHTRVHLQFLSLLLRKRVAGGFAVWRTQTKSRNLQEIRTFSQVEGIRRFLEVARNRKLAFFFAWYSRKARIKGEISRILHTFLRKTHQNRKKIAISVWRGLLSSCHLRTRALQHLQFLLKSHVTAHFATLAHCPATQSRALARKTWATEDREQTLEIAEQGTK